MFGRFGKYRIVETTRKGKKTYTIERKVLFGWVPISFEVLTLVPCSKAEKVDYTIIKTSFHPFTEELARDIISNLKSPLKHEYEGFKIKLIPSTTSHKLSYVTEYNGGYLRSNNLKDLERRIDKVKTTTKIIKV